MSSDNLRDLDREWADDTLSSNSLEYLGDFLLGNPDPTMDIATNCSDEHLPKFIQVLMRCAVDTRTTEELPLETLMAGLHGLVYRYRATKPPDPLGEAIIVALREFQGSGRDSKEPTE